MAAQSSLQSPYSIYVETKYDQNLKEGSLMKEELFQ